MVQEDNGEGIALVGIVYSELVITGNVKKLQTPKAAAKRKGL